MIQTESSQVTVAFELAALQELTDPAAVFRETRSWAESVGILSDRPMYVVTKYAREQGMDYSFHGGPRGVTEALEHIKLQPEHTADRYVLIATTGREHAPVAASGWEMLSIESAAEAAEWHLNTEDDTDWL